MRRRASLLPVILLVGAATGSDAGKDWPQFGGDVQSSSANNDPTGISAANVKSLKRRQVTLDGTVDASAIYLHGVTVKGAPHDVFFVTTSYGKTIAIDAAAGAILWEFTPPDFHQYAGSPLITNSTPAADPDRQHIYAAAPDGNVVKLAVADGGKLWSTSITLLPQREKIASPLKVFRGHVVAVTGGYVGDIPPYQGHVAVLDPQSGKLLHVWNSLCSNRTGLIEPTSCAATKSAIWGRSGAVIDPATGNIFVATGNGPYNGKTYWSDSLIELDPDATRMIGNYTTPDNSTNDRDDLDMGSTSPALLGGGMLVEGGKDRQMRLVDIGGIAGLAAHMDHEAQNLSTPSHDMLYSSPAVWHRGGETWLFVADGGATAAWKFENGKLTQAWANTNAGTTPFEAGGLLFVYDPRGSLRVYDAASGKLTAELPAGRGHWNSPIVVDGRIALPEGDANQHQQTGVLDIWSGGR